MAGPEQYGSNPIARALRALLGVATASQVTDNPPDPKMALAMLAGAQQPSPQFNSPLGPEQRLAIWLALNKRSDGRDTFSASGNDLPSWPDPIDRTPGANDRWPGTQQLGNDAQKYMDRFVEAVKKGPTSKLDDDRASAVTKEGLNFVEKFLAASKVLFSDTDNKREVDKMIKALGATEDDERQGAIKVFLQSVGKTE